MRKIFGLLLVCAGACAGGETLWERAGELTLAPGKGVSRQVALKPEWGVLTLRARIKTDALERGKESWQNGRIPMSFHGADGKMVGGWPNVFGFEGTHDWTDCARDYPVPRGATRLNIGLNNFGTAGAVTFKDVRLEVKRARVDRPANAPLPAGAPADPWGIGDAARVDTATRVRVCLNGLWGARPALTNDAPDTVPGVADNWGWAKVPGLLGPRNAWEAPQQEIVYSDWFEDHGLAVTGAAAAARERLWYRRDFTMPKEAAGRRVALTFTMLNTRATVYVDGARAAEVTFPGGEADITAFVKPGAKQSVALDVTAYPLNPETLDFNAPDRAEAKKSTVKFKGVTGDVWLDLMPRAARVADATAEADTAAGTVKFVAECAGLAAGGAYGVTAVLRGPDGAEAKRFDAKGLKPDAEGRLAFTAAWPDARVWDTHTPGNLYTCALEVRDAAGALVDAALPFRFGFRTIKARGRDLTLNGTPVHLRALYNRTINSQAGAACKASALELIRRLKEEGYNYIIAGNYNFSPGEVSYMDALLDACDETGMLFSFSLPHIRDFKMKLDEPETAARYRALTQWCVRRARNHPAVITWAMNHNATGYTGDMNPLRIDGIYDPKPTPQRSFRNRDQARRAAATARSLDATRPIYHHESGNLDDFHTVNNYLNWAPVQERSDWLEHWAEAGVKPLFFVEWGMPHISSWSSYRGPLFIWRNPALQSLWASEFAAAFRDDAAYEGPTPEAVRALKQEEALWAKGAPFMWSRLCEVLRPLTNNYQGVQALFMDDNWRSHRAWGISATLPWDQESFHRRTASRAPFRENPARWQGLKAPGIVPDFFADEGWDTGTGDAAGFARTSVGETLVRWNRDDCAFIGGARPFTTKEHVYRPGETVEKTLVVLNDRRVAQTVTCAVKVFHGGREVKELARTEKVDVAPGTRRDVPLVFAAPAAAGAGRIEAVFTFADGATQTDSFAFTVAAARPAPQTNELRLYDPAGKTAALFTRLGIRAAAFDPAADGETPGAIVVGRGALTRELLHDVLAPAAKGGARVLVFEQDKATLESVGFRVQEYGLRRAFPRYRDARLGALDRELLRDWRGESTLVEPYLSGLAETEVLYANTRWSGYENTRVWRCRNRGAVATVIPEKPTVGDWRALCDGGFDLQYAPLLDWRIGRGCVTFCQLDVTDRTQAEPAADDLVARLVARAERPIPWDRRWLRPVGMKAWTTVRDMKTCFYEDFNQKDNGCYVVSSGAKMPDDFFARIAQGGRALCVGLTAEEVKRWSPVLLACAETNGCYATRIEKLPPELNGLSNADWSWHGAMDFAAFTEPSPEGNAAFRVVRHGKGTIVFWQVPPWKIDCDARPYLRASRRRADAMYGRLLGNLGFVSHLDRIRYADTPLPEDDPYRYYRW